MEPLRTIIGYLITGALVALAIGMLGYLVGAGVYATITALTA